MSSCYTQTVNNRQEEENDYESKITWFLDLSFYRETDGCLTTSVYRKLTHTYHCQIECQTNIKRQKLLLLILVSNSWRYSLNYKRKDIFGMLFFAKKDVVLTINDY